MPAISDNMETLNLPNSQYQFSAINIADDSLGSSKYTLVTIVVDNSSSVDGMKSEIDLAISEVVKSCQLSPEKDSLMLRVLTFNDYVNEYHGFKLLSTCNPDDYRTLSNPKGMTALVDAVVNAVDATNVYGRKLVDNGFTTNAVIAVITDGEENRSKASIKKIPEEIRKMVRGETVESCLSILIGLNTGGGSLSRYLKDFSDQAEFTQYVDVSDANSKNLAKLATFISKSISAQSQSAGSGGPSQALNF